MKKLHLLGLMAAFCLALLPRLTAQVVINEYSCANLHQFYDSYGSTEDWIELYNTSASPVDLSGYHLSDDDNDPLVWTFPAGATIGAGDYLLVWASGRDLFDGQRYHTNFRLTQTKNNAEHLILAAPGGTVLDDVKINKTKIGQSRARIVDGGAEWGIFSSPSLDASNNGGTWFDSFADRPSFNYDAGFYETAITLEITNNADSTAQIFYTLDGLEPTPASTLYTGPIEISQTTVVKAIAVSADPKVLTSFIEFGTYFINEHHTVVVVSVSANELDDLANGNQELRPHGSIEYFGLDGTRKARSYGEFNSHGQDSWVNDHRSLDLVCRDEMGYSKALKEKIFSRSTRDEFQRLILRAAGDDNYPGNFLPQHDGCAHLRDAYVHNLADRGGLHLDLRRSEKAVVYLNGQYWGVYDLREIPDDNDYTEYYYNQGKYDIQYLLTWGNTWAEYGGQQALNDWSSLRSYINSHNMSNQAYFDYVANQLDVKSLVDYIIVNSVTVCSDWLNYNTGWWRGFNPDGGHQKWGYILWDNDATFGYYINYTGIDDTSATAEPCQVETLTSQWPDLNGHMRTLNKLRQNAEFDRYYKSRYVDLMNTVFSCENMLSYLDTVANTIAPEMPRQIARWGGTYEDWQNNVARLRFFIERRCEAMSAGMNECYNLDGPYAVTFDADPANAVKAIQVNSLTLNELPATVNLFAGLEVLVDVAPDSAVLAADQLKFDRWSTEANTFLAFGDTSKINLLAITASDTLTAHFVDIVSAVGDLPAGIQQPTLSAQPTLVTDQFTAVLDLPQAAPVSLRLFNSAGQPVATLAAQSLTPGRYTYTVQRRAQSMPAGLYLLQLEAGGRTQVVKLVVN